MVSRWNLQFLLESCGQTSSPLWQQEFFFVRLQSNQGVVSPYLEGLIGLHNLFTETQTGNGVIAKGTNQEDSASLIRRLLR